MTLQLKLTEVKFGEESPIGFKPAHRALIDRLPNLKGARREHIFSIPTRFKAGFRPVEFAPFQQFHHLCPRTRD